MLTVKYINATTITTTTCTYMCAGRARKERMRTCVHAFSHIPPSLPPIGHAYKCLESPFACSIIITFSFVANWLSFIVIIVYVMSFFLRAIEKSFEVGRTFVKDKGKIKLFGSYSHKHKPSLPVPFIRCVPISWLLFVHLSLYWLPGIIVCILLVFIYHKGHVGHTTHILVL